MKERSQIRIGAVVCCIALATIAAAPKKRSPVRYGFPKIPAGKVWVSSIPVGLDVYLSAQPQGKSVGRTPLLLDAPKKAGPVTVSLPKKNYGGDLPEQTEFIDFTSQTTHSVAHRDGDVAVDLSRGLTYRLDPASKRTLIALFQARSVELSDWARRYPPGRNFSFQDGAVRKDLAGRGVPTVQIDLGIQLLHRGGKIALPGADGWLVAEVQPSGEVTITAAPR
jgi:hypothetical protein